MSLVFVSYSRNNFEAIKQIVGDLHDVGVNTWYDQELDCGQKWWDTILEEIRKCDLFIVALSPESCSSEACSSEWKYAAQLGKPILPVQVADGVNLNLLPPPLNERQVTDYRLRDKPATLALFKAINKSHAAPPLPDPLPEPPEIPGSYVFPLKERIDSKQPLSGDDQSLLFLKLEEAVEEGRSKTEIRDLLLSLKKRDDLLAKVCAKIDALLKKLDEATSVPTTNGSGRHEPTGSGGLVQIPPPPAPRLCPNCSAQAGPEQIFCGSCGNRLSGAVENDPGDMSRPGWKSCRYVCAPGDFQRVLTNVVGWLNSQGFDTQQKHTEHYGLLLRVERRGGWRGFVGMATSLDVLFQQSGNMLTVATGAGKWSDKAVSGAASIIFPPLAATAGYGAWEQAKMPEKIFAFIGTRVPFK